ncbi:MAG: hypothetical protein ACTSUE_22835 [Promethearchaeota archaeon]
MSNGVTKDTRGCFPSHPWHLARDAIEEKWEHVNVTCTEEDRVYSNFGMLAAPIFRPDTMVIVMQHGYIWAREIPRFEYEPFCRLLANSKEACDLKFKSMNDKIDTWCELNDILRLHAEGVQSRLDKKWHFDVYRADAYKMQQFTDQDNEWGHMLQFSPPIQKPKSIDSRLWNQVGASQRACLEKYGYTNHVR